MPKNPEMHAGASYVLDDPVVSTDNGVLRAKDFDDVYFSVDDGLAETIHVFLGGNDLPARMKSASHLTIAETGFGSGLNLLAVMQIMATYPDLQMDFISVEALPLHIGQMKMVHDQFPILAPFAKELREKLPPRWPGHHCAGLLGGRLSLHLLYGEAEHVLAQSDFTADAWFLDGFTPAKNPAMWSPSVLAHIARLTAAGGSFATFTAASAVREGLTSVGFDVKKADGFGRKRDMLCGTKIGSVTIRQSPAKRVGIVGGGIAGASVVAGLRRRGAEPVIFDMADRLASGGSGNRLALQTPRLSVDHNPASRMSATCLGFAARLADQLGASRVKGIMSLDAPEREAIRHQKFRSQEWPNDLIRTFSSFEASRMSGAPINSDSMFYDMGRIVDPMAFVQELIGQSEVLYQFCVESVTQAANAVIVTAADGRTVEIDSLVLATGAMMGPLLSANNIHGVHLDVTSGQVSHMPVTKRSKGVVTGLSFGGYLTPAIDGFHELGATFDRSGALEMTEEGHLHNINLLPQSLQELFNPLSLDTFAGRVGQRASTPDRNPIMGMLSDRIYGLGGLSARGFTVSPLLGDMLAADILGRPNTLERSIRGLLDPYRFRMRSGRF